MKNFRELIEKIEIDPEHKGEFTEYCKKCCGSDEVTDECIEKGLKDPDPKVRKQANFARNARKFKH